MDLEKAPDEVIRELQSHKDSIKTIQLDSLQLSGEINSILIKNTIGFLIHTAKYEYISRKLFNLVDNDTVNIFISNDLEDKIIYFLDVVCKETGESRSDLLYRITLFKKKSDQVVPGRKSIFDLSDSHKKVLLDKLSKIIKQRNDTGAAQQAQEG